jgi:hypothetical protein
MASTTGRCNGEAQQLDQQLQAGGPIVLNRPIGDHEERDVCRTLFSSAAGGLCTSFRSPTPPRRSRFTEREGEARRARAPRVPVFSS